MRRENKRECESRETLLDDTPIKPVHQEWSNTIGPVDKARRANDGRTGAKLSVGPRPVVRVVTIFLAQVCKPKTRQEKGNERQQESRIPRFTNGEITGEFSVCVSG